MSSTHPLARYPRWITRWLGYRATPPPKRPEYLVWFWSFIGAFSGLCVLQAVFGHARYFIDRGVPSMVASYGASAVLCYGAIEAPLAQPRALIGGHFISALLGLCITKLFSLSPHFESIRWLAASLSTSVAIVAMQITGTTHPPAGATALLPALDDDVWHLSWYYLPVVLLSSMLVLVTALLVNNVQRRYPIFWFTPATPPVAKTSAGLGAPNVQSDDADGIAGRSSSATVSTSAPQPAEKQTAGDIV
ncbi:HPP family-domain-containing protein [Rhodofomes roseus]|uniref:HPP family-domain-containing protein n=1 Tax=Rhodofomes roseus TaxID=34475 RepID=A0ABQ8KF67_9APHY|nr:HPP family-domain-containing protein [Rhodofomes roseus]KAH9836365.1 HPP family-domain-containing protein [Rhodofomes roseus]